MPPINSRDFPQDSYPPQDSAFRKMTPTKVSALKTPIYVNVIEAIVTEEVERQLKKLPLRLSRYINPTQAIAYALNRLPPLYATSEEGWDRQQQRAKSELREQIIKAVRQGLAAVQKDPLKVATPLKRRGDLELENSQKSWQGSFPQF